MLLKIVKDRQNVKVDVANDATLLGLAKVIEEKFQAHGYTFDLLLGYPPKVVTGDSAASLTTLGFKNGEVVTLRENIRKKEAFDGLSAMGFSHEVIGRTFNLLDPATLSLDVAIDLCMQISSDGEHDLLRQKVTRRIIDADNSCLFNAIGFSLSGGEAHFRSFNPLIYRKVIAEAVLADPVTYTADMLDKPPQEYAAWIVQPEKWGGEIELYILAQHFKVEIVAVDIRTGNFLTYGEASSSTGNRVYVMYDGAHYDAVTRAKGPGAAEECLFASSDTDTFNEVTELARTLKDSRQFINLATGGLECKICFTRLDGEKAAVEHAKTTGHQNFGQV